jgi:feruloyl esterase
MRLMKLVGVIFAQSSVTMLISPASTATTCESLSSLSLADTTITMAQTVAAGALTLPTPLPAAGPRGGLTFVSAKGLPEFCRVSAVSKPSKDSEIKFEVWMPASSWNGKLIGVGNGAMGGSISYGSMAATLARGYAASSTDTGHEGTGQDGSYALGHREKVIDFGYRAVHEMTVKAKLIIAAHYGRAPQFSFWNGCSTGGRQALAEAQRFPADYNGIVAGAPALFLTHMQAASIWKAQAIRKNPGGLVPPSKLLLIHNAVLAACDARDGVKDGLLDDPRLCNFDPKILECKGENSPDCLTAAQITVVRAFCSPTVNPRTKAQIFPGLVPGSELGWSSNVGRMYADPPDITKTLATAYLRYAVFQDPEWDYMTFDFGSGMALADRIDDGVTKATDPNLQDFFGSGGRLLQFHGWSDPSISPLNSINYYNSVVDFMGGAANVRDSYRLFMAPGMDHCGGGNGPNTFDSIRAIEEWVEAGKAPDRIIASQIRDGKTERTRPLCPYPQVATYRGTGSTDDAANFSCSVPKSQVRAV